MDWLADRVDTLAKQASEITLYDVKSVVNKAKAYALNLTEYEQKVREATNDDPWGASSTLMQDIARGTFDFQLFNEIMPTIYSRFTEKEARQWRQIYKGLVLLEYLVKNGSERVIDDARSHLSLIKVLRNFHYIDEAGKDQGINVRNRAKELGELLSDLDRVRQERRKAKQNRNKYTGVGNDGSGGGGPSFTSASGSRYGGFGSDTFNNGGSDSYGGSSGGGGFSDSRGSAPQDFEEYDAGDDEEHSNSHSHAQSQPSRSSTMASSSTSSSRSKPTPTTPKPAPAPAPKQPEVNLFDFDDDEPLGGPVAVQTSPPPPPKPTANLFSNVPAVSAAASLDGKSPFPPFLSSLDDENSFLQLVRTRLDDFDDFQSAVPSPAPTPSAPVRQTAPPSSSSQNVFSMLNQQPQRPSAPSASSFSPPGYPSSTPSVAPTSSVFSRPAATPSAQPKPAPSSGGGADFSDLFSFTSTPSASASGGAKAAGQKQSMAEIAAQKRQDSLFASSATANKNNNGFGGASNGGGGDGWDSLI
ncbi:hypothetical protein JCM11491_003757 [Sporobolomyces phaffii]